MKHLPTRRRGPFREDWYSICSKHAFFDANCKLCIVGNWENKWKLFLSHIVFKLAPGVWCWIVNHKPISFINFHTGEKEVPFPNLKHGKKDNE